MIELVKPPLADIPAMQALVAKEVASGVILERSDDEIATNIRSYVLARQEGYLVGYTALHVHSPRMAEIRSLVVDREFRGQSIGQQMVLFALEEARTLGVDEVLALTYVADFFRKLGFVEIDKESIPEHKIWADCIKCIHFPVCNEVSLVYTIGKGQQDRA
jgi:amino-acid N-acetyltransferase